jgi:hypothetical protein
MKKDGSKKTVPRLVLESAQSFINARNKYACFSLMDYVNGNVAFALNNGLHELLGVTGRDLSEYSRIRNLRDFSARPLILNDKKHNSCFEDDECFVWVSSMDTKDGKNPYKVIFTDLARVDDAPAEKLKSMAHLMVHCDCMINDNVSICRAPISQRLEQGDKRIGASIPNPYVESRICKHATAAWNYLSVFLDAEDYNLYGLSSRGMGLDATREIIDEVLGRSVEREVLPYRKYANYKINHMFSGLQDALFEDFKKYTRLQLDMAKKAV